jgi:phenylpyruvate tautomerase PptA (4-oxalocrotonate tautomerase family)
MPILDLEFVGHAEADLQPLLAQAVADAVAQALACGPGRVWVRLRGLPAHCYAENHSTLAVGQLPVFATLLHAHPPTGDALLAEVAALTQVIAQACERDPQQVHLQYAPAAVLRQAFGGRLVGAG